MAKSTAPALPMGALIGVYEIKDVLNSDWSSILYRAWNEHLNTMVILKEYFPSDYAVRDVDGKTVKAKSNTDESIFKYGMEKFLELAEQLEDIQHPNIISVHNVLQFNETAYLAMDFVHGTPLSKIQEGTSPFFSDEKSKQTLHSLLNGLQTLHNKNNIHGDINPSNIIINSKTGEPVLVNFAGASIALSDYIQQHTSSKEVNPQQENLSSSGSDLYALGASLFFCVTGQYPAPLLERQTAINKSQPDPCQTALDHIKTESNETLLKTIGGMLTIDPQQRPQSAQEVLTEMDEGSIESNSTVNSSDQPLTALILTGLATCLALIAGSVWFFTQQPSPDKTITASNSIEQEILVKEKQTKKDTAKYLSEESESATALTEYEEPNTKKTNLPDSTTTALKSNDLINQKEPTIEKTPSTKQDGSKENSAPIQPPEYSTEMAANHQENTELSIEQKEKIIQHLAAAKKNVELLNFTTPVDNNAYDQYQAVLSINKENTEAIEGLQLIFKTYITYIEKAIKEGKFATASTYIRRAESIKTDTPEIQYLREELKKHGDKPQKDNVFLRDSVA